MPLTVKEIVNKIEVGDVIPVIGYDMLFNEYESRVEKDFLKNEKWVKHEMCHIQQFKKFGFFKFIYQYLRESARVGYYNNRFEAEARKAESE